MVINMVEKLIKNTIQDNNLLKKGDHVIVGLSGGPDSMCLFLVLLDLRDELELNISAVHVNHMFRAGFAQRDQEYVEAFCSKVNIPCKVSVVDCTKMAKEQGLTDEEAGRNARYEAFYATAKKMVDDGISSEKIKIAVAQNKNDQAETLLMRIMRGTGTQGLSGMEYSRMGEHGTLIIRPLLDVSRNDIETFCREQNINPCLDHTNEEAIYARNKVRLELIPYIVENFNENIVESLFRLSQNAKEDNGYLLTQAQVAYMALKKEKSEKGTFINSDRAIILDRKGLKMLDSAIRRRVILLAFFEIGLKQDFLSAHTHMIDQIIFSENASAKVNLPNKYEISVSYDEAIVYLKKDLNAHEKAQAEVQDFEVVFISEYEVGKHEAIIKQKQSKTNIAAFDYDALEKVTKNAKEKILVRGREQGDYFVPSGMTTGRKKVQDYFVDRKIPKENRENYKLAVLEKEVLWIFDPIDNRHSEISEKYKVTSETKRVLLLEIK
jgi:tRNA(Ile)-lysidine synthase